MNAANSTDLRFSVLGPVRAWHADRELDLGSPQQRAVLAALLLRRGHPVSLAELVDAVWGVEPPTAAVSVLRTYVSRLRKVLEPGRGPEDPPRTIVSVGDGYRACIPEQALDLTVFERRTADAAKAAATGEVSTAARLLHDALDGWPGAALAGLPGPLAESERARLAEERLSALEIRLDLDVRLGRHGQVIAELMSLTGEHPLREELCRLLMLALYRSGRQAEALAAYRRTRATLVTELGIEPGAPLRDLHARILATDASLGAGASSWTTPGGSSPQEPPVPAAPQPPETQSSSAPAGVATAPATPPSPAPRTKTSERPARRPAYAPRLAQLPADLPTFTGREAELKATLGMLPLDGSAPATLVISAIGGMAGVGKTTLAVHLAHRVAARFPDGQLCVNLRGFDPTGSVMSSQEAIRVLLDALGVPPQRLPAGLEAQTALYRSVLAERRVLILLDNARDAEQVRPLLPGSPGCFVIVTSRNQLTGLVAGEGAHPLTLNQLTPAEAHEFLARRLGAARLEREPRAVDEIISRCALLPLALAVVAARAATHPDFPLSAIAEELRDSDDSLDAFAGDDITIDVRTVFSLSYEALSAPAARLFRLLGLHAGPDLSSPAAAALAGLTPRETRGLLVELTRAHLLTEYFPGRYTLHDLLRVYAAERVRAEESPRDRDLAVERLLSWYLHTAAAAYPLITPNRNPIPLDPPPASCRPLSFTTLDQAVDWCETERSNLVGAVHQAADSGQPGIAWRLPAVLWGFFYLRSHLGDWLDTTRTGLSAARAAQDSRGESQALADAAAALRSNGRFDEAIELFHRSIAVCRELGDMDGRLRAVGNLGDAYLQTGRLDKAVEYSRRGLALDRIVGDIWGEGIALSNLGDAYQRLGRFDDAVDCLEQALTVLRASGNRWVEGVALDVLGTVHHRLGARDRAVEYYRQALDAHRDIGNRWGEGHTLGHLGDVQLAAGEPEAADGSWRQALGVFAEFDHPDAAKIQEKLRSLQLASR
ncbi:BTAD domain-containing putative transcriptional regulator [Streptomyces sp. SLBN-31]|uniref:AfsR/SARP family transcriptional regulator n=1 Tax=Streptomyces sp. SLBN-31 TaxID=2768444 RepID=UPI001172A18C|nr:BTAD domain-containing putative transcriptional regulator [Streptomyces sp. SLBN-31]TQJ87734.1 DNA-binding SARP family transcriptional activator [Streptomyces sp. SLBN-31]